MDRVRSSIRGIAVFALKFAVAAGIIWLLAAGNAGALGEAFRSFDRRFFPPALAFYLVHMLVSAWRWYGLARSLGFKLTMAEAVSITMQGYFFSLVIPAGAVGGDVARIAILSRRAAPGTGHTCHYLHVKRLQFCPWRNTMLPPEKENPHRGVCIL